MKKYNLYTNNCVDACQDAIRRNNRINLPLDINPKPNAYFSELSEYVHWFNLPPAEKQRLIDKAVKKARDEMIREPKY